MPLSRILLPVDFSEQASGAACYAGMLACRFRSELTMLHVTPASDYIIGSVDAPPIYNLLIHDRAEQLRRTRETLDSFVSDELSGPAVRRVLFEGDPASKIVEVAHSERMSLIVMPTHGYGRFRRFILGSVTAKVLHDADCPVFTGVHLEAASSPATLFRSILCALDLGPQSRAVLDWAAAMAKELNAELNVVHVLPPEVAGQARYFDPAWKLDLERAAKDSITDLQDRDGSNAGVILEPGEIAAVVREVAQRVGADLVVIGRHPESGLFGRLRSHAYAIVRESPCPVVSV